VSDAPPADLLDQLVAIGIVPLCGAKGYAHLVEWGLGIKAKTVRNLVSGDENLRRRWLELVPTKEACNHFVELPGVRYGIASILSADGMRILLEGECHIVPIDAS
jgi:hypothetical protein